MINKSVDPVCGMEVDVEASSPKSEYMGKTYYFCTPEDKVEFDKHPAKYAVKGKIKEVMAKK